MGVTAKKNTVTTRSRSKRKARPMTKAEMVKKMLADQQFLHKAIRNGMSLEELEEKYGYKFARLPHIKGQ
jgi:hypothetical protein